MDFCFYDGEVLVQEGAAAALESESAPAVDAPVPPGAPRTQGDQQPYVDEPEAPVSPPEPEPAVATDAPPAPAPVEAAPPAPPVDTIEPATEPVSTTETPAATDEATAVADEAPAPADEAPAAPPVADTTAPEPEAPPAPDSAEPEPVEAAAAASPESEPTAATSLPDTADLEPPPSPSPASTAETPVPAPQVSRPAAAGAQGAQQLPDTEGGLADALPADLEAASASAGSDEDTIPPVPTPLGSSSTPTSPGPSHSTPTSPRPSLPPRAMTFEAEEDAGDRGSMIAVGAVALFLGMVFIIGAGVAALTMGGSALLDPEAVDAVGDARPQPVPVPEPTRPPVPPPDGDAPTGPGTDAAATGEDPDGGTSPSERPTGETPPAPTPVAPQPEAAPPTPPPAPEPPPAPAPPTPAPTAPAPVAPAPQPAPAPDDGVADAQTARSNKGTVRFSSTPSNATLTIDGRPYGRTPKLVELPLGDHSYSVQMDGFETVKETVNVTGGPQLDAEVRLTPAAEAPEPAPSVDVERLVFLKFATAGVLYLDGNEIGPLTQRYQLPTGEHLLEVKCSGQLVFSVRHSITQSGSRILRLHELTGAQLPMSASDRAGICGG